MPTTTPWGSAQTSKKIVSGMMLYTTASHGGYHLSPKLNCKVHEAWRNDDGWYEEDCAWSVVALTFPQYFTQEEVEHARETAKKYYGKTYYLVAMAPLDPEPANPNTTQAPPDPYGFAKPYAGFMPFGTQAQAAAVEDAAAPTNWQCGCCLHEVPSSQFQCPNCGTLYGAKEPCYAKPDHAVVPIAGDTGQILAIYEKAAVEGLKGAVGDTPVMVALGFLAWREIHKEDWISVSAWSDTVEGVPKGMVGVCATKGGNTIYNPDSGTAGGVTERWFMISALEYHPTSLHPYGFVIDLARHVEVVKFV